MTGLIAVIVVLALSTAAGLVWRRANGRMRAVPVAEPDPAPDDVMARLGVDPSAAPVTLVQFSTAFCQPCRATRQVLSQVVRQLPVVQHVEVDAESHLDEVRELGIVRTPTVLVVDRSGRVVNRAIGQPRPTDVITAVAPHL